jgi:hypothetical protein
MFLTTPTTVWDESTKIASMANRIKNMWMDWHRVINNPSWEDNPDLFKRPTSLDIKVSAMASGSQRTKFRVLLNAFKCLGN